MSTIEEFELKFDQQGDVIPAEYFSGNGKKNYVAHILGRDPKYTWRRQFLDRFFKPGMGARYRKEAFVEGEVYQIHASFLPTPVQESELRQSGEFNRGAWLKDRMNRVNSKYNGFWKFIGTTETGLKMERLHPGDLNFIFPRNGRGEDSYQTSLSQFSDDKEEHIL